MNFRENNKDGQICRTVYIYIYINVYIYIYMYVYIICINMFDQFFFFWNEYVFNHTTIGPSLVNPRLIRRYAGDSILFTESGR